MNTTIFGDNQKSNNFNQQNCNSISKANQLATESWCFKDDSMRDPFSNEPLKLSTTTTITQVEDNCNLDQIISRKIPKKNNKNNAKLLGKRKRQQNRVRKDEGQIQQLIAEFRRDADWSKEHVTYLSKTIGLSESQVYKWAWDQKKKLNNHSNSNLQYTMGTTIEEIQGLQGTAEVTRDEFGGYCCKRWAKKEDILDDGANDNICEQLGLDINALAINLVQSDFKQRQLQKSPLSARKRVNPIILYEKSFKTNKTNPQGKKQLENQTSQSNDKQAKEKSETFQAKLAKMLQSPNERNCTPVGKNQSIFNNQNTLRTTDFKNQSPPKTSQIKHNEPFLTPRGYQDTDQRDLATQNSSAMVWRNASAQSKQNDRVTEFLDGTTHLTPTNLQHNFREQTESSSETEKGNQCRFQRSKKNCCNRNICLKKNEDQSQLCEGSINQNKIHNSINSNSNMNNNNNITNPMSPSNMLGGNGSGGAFNPSPFSTRNPTPNQQQLKSPLMCSQFMIRFGESTNN